MRLRVPRRVLPSIRPVEDPVPAPSGGGGHYTTASDPAPSPPAATPMRAAGECREAQLPQLFAAGPRTTRSGRPELLPQHGHVSRPRAATCALYVGEPWSPRDIGHSTRRPGFAPSSSSTEAWRTRHGVPTPRSRSIPRPIRLPIHGLPGASIDR